MPLPPPKSTTSRKARQNRHPYIVKLEVRIGKLNKMLGKVQELADCDLVVSDAKTGVNDYSMNLRLSRKLQDVAKALETTANELYEKSKTIIEKVNIARDFKASIQPVQFIEEITDPKLKNKKAKAKPAERYKPSCDFPIKTEVLDDDKPVPPKSTGKQIDPKSTDGKQIGSQIYWWRTGFSPRDRWY